MDGFDLALDFVLDIAHGYSGEADLNVDDDLLTDHFSENADDARVIIDTGDVIIIIDV